MKFNPIKDLTPFDRSKAVKQLGGVTDEEISSLSSGLRDTSLRTSAIVDQLRRDVSLLKRDLDKISELDRRLKRVIPIIPGQGAVAGNIFPEDKPGPSGGLNIPIPKFPKIPPFTPVPAPAPVNVPDPGPVTVPEKEPEKPPITIPTIPFPIPFPIPNPEDLLPQVIAANTSFINKINDIAFKVGDDLVALSKLQPKGGKYQPMSPMEQLELVTMASPGGFGFKAGGMFLMNPAILRLLPKGTQRFAQSLFGGAATSAPTVQPAIPLTSRMPRPGQLRPDQVAPRAARIPTPPAAPSNLYDQLLKSTRFGMSSMGQVGARLGGERALRRAPLMKRFDTGGIFRQGTVPEEVYAMRRALRDIGLDEELARIGDPTNLSSQLAKSDVLKQLGLADEAFEKIMGGGARIPKKTVSPTKFFGPNRYTATQIDQAIEVLKSPQARGLAQPGSVSSYMQLDHPEVRQGFLDYLLSAKKGDGSPNYGLYEKVLRQIGLLGDRPVQIDDDAFRFILNYHKKVGLDPDLLVKELLNKEMLGKETYVKYLDKIGDTIRSSKMSPLNVKPLDVGPVGVPGNQPILPGGPQSSVMGRPRSMDIASLGIDTSVEVQEIYYIVG
jgi:hypothetical protein